MAFFPLIRIKPAHLLLLAALVGLGLFLNQPDQALAEPYLDKVEATPDYTQTNPAYGGLPEGGGVYCGPVAVSNTLMWLADNGFQVLAPDSGDRKADQFIMIRILGDENHMDTDLDSGTGTKGVIEGVTQYLLERGLDYQRLDYQGWRVHPDEAETGQEWPQLEWIREGMRGLGGVWLNIGWYTYDQGTFYRIGGHWVTLVGYGHDGQEPNDQYLIIHDPSSRDGMEFNNCHVRLYLLKSGVLDGPKTGLPRPAAGYYMLDGELKENSKADCGILDGAVVIEMPAP